MSSAASLPSTRRPIPLEKRPYLDCRELGAGGKRYWVIKDATRLKYFRLQPEQYEILNLLDGKRSLEDVRRELIKKFPYVRPSVTDLQQLAIDLYRQGMAQSTRPGQGPALVKQAVLSREERVLAALSNVLSLRIPGFDCDRLLTRLVPYLGWVFTLAGALPLLLVVIASLAFFGTHYEEFRREMPAFQQFFGWPNVIYLWITMALVKVVHEFGHGLAAKKYGCECHDLGVMVMLGTPTLYCDVSDSWMLRNKWRRIVIGAAGMWFELLLSTVALYVYWNSDPGLVRHACMNVFFVSAVSTLVFNLNPLMRFDGYFMLSDFLEIPNLRSKSDKVLGEQAAWWCLGIRSQPDPFLPQHNVRWFFIYAVAAKIYACVVFFGITMFLYNVLKPYGLQSLGAAAAVITVALTAWKTGRAVYAKLTEPREEPMSRRKMLVTATVTAAIAAAFFLAPLPLPLKTALTVEPAGLRRVYAMADGRLEEVLVRPGDRVRSGQLLLRFSDVSRDLTREKLSLQRELQEIEVRLQSALDSPGEVIQARDRLKSLGEQIADCEQRLAELQVIAPCDGVVVAAPRVERPKRDPSHAKLEGWSGTPLDAKNLGGHFPVGTHLLSVAPGTDLRAVILIDQGDRDNFRVGQAVRMKFDCLPEAVFSGKIAAISQRHSEYAPDALSMKRGGDLATTGDSQGRERLNGSSYEALVDLEDDPSYLQTGVRGIGRYWVTDRTAAHWLRRMLSRTFHFEL
jgi:putative peptide zinc metalloprotease protein